MLCSIEFGTTKGYTQSQQHYWVVANSLARAIAIATRMVVEDYPNKAKEDEWEVIEAKIKSVEDPLIDWERMNIIGDASHARVSVS